MKSDVNNVLNDAKDYQLKLVKIDKIFPHEEIEEKKVEKITQHMQQGELLKHPISCIYIGKGYMALDGHHRLAALKRMNCSYAVIQVINEESLKLDYWYHCFSDCEIANNLNDLNNFSNEKDSFIYSNLLEAPFYVCSSKEVAYETMWKFYDLYKSKKYYRVENLQSNKEKYWIQYTGVSLDMIISFTLNNQKIPPGLTKFVFPYRILNLDVPLKLLYSGEQKEWEVVKEKLTNSQVHNLPVISVN